MMSIFLLSCKEKELDWNDNGKTIDVAVGQIIKISLPSNASTGNKWRKTVYDNNFIITSGKPNYMLGDKDAMGSGGILITRFKAIKEGETKIYMEYGNRFEFDKEPLKVFEINLKIHPQQ